MKIPRFYIIVQNYNGKMVYHRLRHQNVPLSLICSVQSDHIALE